jgi:uncharacterized protein YdaU (DUF1376 family)
MALQPWFKMYAADYLLDPDADAMPREAEGLLLRMWCVVHREGSCPADIETLARKTQCSQEYVSKFKGECERFFELREGRIYSPRMEEEKRRSEQARQNANKRFGKQSAERTAEPVAEQTAEPRSDSDSDSVFGFKNSPRSRTTVSTLEENARAREARGKPKYDAAVGLQIDWRKWCKARNELQLKLSSGWGAELSDEQLFHEQCVLAGVTAEVGRELANRALGASA